MYTKINAFSTNVTVNPNCNTLLDIPENDITLVTVFPNPFTDEITITSDAMQSFKMFDFTGKHIAMTSNANRINTAALAAGIYFLRIETTSGNLETFKLIKR
ncbi:MAG: T9SS type A sorting domain-containing protein [Winogradskyella sp.]